MSLYPAPRLNIERNEMSVEEAIDYCYKHRDKYLSAAYAAGENGQRQFDCLISCLEYGTIKPEELADYGMDFE